MRSYRVLRAGTLAFMLSMLPLAAQAETLREALESAYANNPNIMSALLSVKMSAEDIALRKAGKLPQINLEGSVGGSFRTDPLLGQTVTSPNWQLGLSYRQNLFDNFQTESQIEQARALTELSKYALRNEEQNVLLQVVTSYMNVLRDTQLVQLRGDNVAFFEAQVASSEDRLRLGEGTRIEVSQAQARLAQNVAAYQAAVANLQTSRASYERWVGHPPRNLSSEFRFGDLIPASVDIAIGQAEMRNPAILTARASIRAAQAGSDAARAAFGPTFDLIGSLCGIGCVPGNSAQTGMSGSLTLSVTVPLYAGGSLGASVRKANLGQIQSEVDALSTRDQVRESVISAWSSMQNAAAQIQSAESAVASGRLVVEGLIQEREVGQRTTLDVLNAQAELTSAREGLISATSSRVIAAFALVAATGRLSPDELGLNVEVKSADGYIATVEDVWQELRAIDE